MMKRHTATRKAKEGGTVATVLKAHRFNSRLFRQFEGDCLRHLQAPKVVIEALITYWLAADTTTRATIAKRYRSSIKEQTS